MRRTLGSMGAWFLATGLAVLVSWLGVRSVLLAAVPDRARPMSAAEVRRVVPKTATPFETVNPSGGGSSSGSPSPSQTPSPSPSRLVRSVPAPTPDERGWIQVPDGRGGVALITTVPTEGGAARIRFTETDVRVLSTEPAPGFVGSWSQQAPAVAIVTFKSPGHVSKITAFWERGARAQVSETQGG